MVTVTFLNNPVHTAGELPQRGTTAPKFELVKGDLSTLTNEELRGKRVLLNIFPSLDTNVCATSVRKFNQKAAQMKNTLVLAVSKDLPFAQSVRPKVSTMLSPYRLSVRRSSGKNTVSNSSTGHWPACCAARSSSSTNREKSCMNN